MLVDQNVAQHITINGSTTVTGAADALIKARHWKRARAQVEPLYKANPNDAELNYLMSQIDGAFADLTSARDLAEKSVALKNSESRYHRQLADVADSEDRLVVTKDRDSTVQLTRPAGFEPATIGLEVM